MSNQTEENVIVPENQQVVSSKDLTPAQIERYKSITKGLVVTDRNSILNYGNELHTIMEQNSHEMLKVARASDGNQITKLTYDLRNKLGMVNPGELEESTWKKVMRNIPIVKHFVPSVAQLLTKYDSIEDNVVAISKQILSVALMSKRDNSEIEIMRQNNIRYIEQTDELIEAAVLKSEELKNQLYKMQENKDDYESYELTEISNFIEALDRKIYNMRQSRFSLGLSITELDITQNNNSLVAETAENFVNDVIPQWRNQLSISLMMDNTKKRLEGLKEARNANNEILLGNAKFLKANALEAAKQSQEGMYKIETLEQASNLIIETLDKLDQIADKAAEERKAYTAKLNDLENKMAESRERITVTKNDVNYITDSAKTLKELQG